MQNAPARHHARHAETAADLPNVLLKKLGRILGHEPPKLLAEKRRVPVQVPGDHGADGGHERAVLPRTGLERSHGGANGASCSGRPRVTRSWYARRIIFVSR